MDSDEEAEEIASDDGDFSVKDRDDDAYSVEFEDDFETPSPPKAKAAPKAPPAKAPPVKAPPPPKSDTSEYENDYDDDFENDDAKSEAAKSDAYGDASFENDSRASSPRHHVNLSVPTRPPSPTHASPDPVLLLKQQAATQSPGKLRILERIDEAPPIVTSTSTSNKYIRQLEAQLLDENEVLKHEHAMALRAASELKNELRFTQQRHLDEKRLRQEKFQLKKKRADERRLQHELLLQTTKNALTDLELKYVALEASFVAKVVECETLQAKLDRTERDRRTLEERQLQLSEMYQHCLGDLHSGNAKLEAAVDARQATQHKYEQALLDHRVAIQVVEQRCAIQLQCMQETLQKTLTERDVEKVALPENHRLIVEAQRERFEKLEAAVLQEKKDLEAAFRRERERYEKSLAMANELRIQAEERADTRIRDEAMKIYRERDAIDEQRRQLLSGLAIQNARLDDERGKLEALRTQLEEKRLKLVQDELHVEALAKSNNARLLDLTRDEDIISRRKRELLDLSATTLEKSKNYSQIVRELDEKKVLLEELKTKYDQLMASTKQRTTDADQKREALEREKAALDRSAYQLHQDKLQLAKQRLEARQMLDGTRKLDGLLRQQAALNYQPHFAYASPPPPAYYAQRSQMAPAPFVIPQHTDMPQLAQFLATWDEFNSRPGFEKSPEVVFDASSSSNLAL
ncbi:hypothetical protein SDRG_06333 [Saprolegnia diclina VS20]|uniref:Uncharacterized protein n=1 Tax=Saprolegnia diclina (strain VS20) TaxID=1156394 RepID=T0QND2_SAPDV|nr:hypothetical protein SDRG_06333 [Saprolegnia diclina VS20]EQC36226.1 hypothetical protein SDRG_06333 [Saprolegnia diclina VS20]|eukprot:XP_008610332.1 hypothetical protein SDRG_06333 [Saprolegnia diclina VS20]